MGNRFFSYTQIHGGGVPALDEAGRPALQNHGIITYVTPQVYREAVRRFYLMIGSILLTLVTFVLLILWYKGKLGRERLP